MRDVRVSFGALRLSAAATLAMVTSAQTSVRRPCIFGSMKPKNLNPSERKLLANVEKEMDLPRLAESVREGRKDGPAPPVRKPSGKSPVA